jgi:hypothetical protein
MQSNQLHTNNIGPLKGSMDRIKRDLKRTNQLLGAVSQSIEALTTPRDKSKGHYDRSTTRALGLLKSLKLPYPSRKMSRSKAGREALVWSYLSWAYFVLTEKKAELQGQLRQSQRGIRRLGRQKIAVRLDLKFIHHPDDKMMKTLLRRYGPPFVETSNNGEYQYYENGMINYDELDGRYGDVSKTFLYKSTRAGLEQGIRDFLGRYTNEALGGPMYTIFTHIESTISTQALPKYTSLTVPLKDRHSPKLVTFDDEGAPLTRYINNFNDQCVIDYLYEHCVLPYAKNKALGLRGNGNFPYMDRSKIVAEIKSSFEEGNMLCDGKYDPVTDGVSVQQLECFAKRYNISLRVCDPSSQQFHAYIPKSPRKIESLMCVVSHGHIYPIVSPLLRLSLKNSGRGVVVKHGKRDDKGNTIKPKVKLPSFMSVTTTQCTPQEILELSESHKGTTFVCIDGDENTLETLFRNFLIERNEIYHTKYVSTRMSSIYLPNKCELVSNPDFTLSKEISDSLDHPFTNQSLLMITKELYEKSEGPLAQLASHVNGEVLSTLKSDLWCGNWVRTFDTPKVGDDVKCYDENKMYTSIISDPKFETIRLDITSEIIPYSLEEIRGDSLYYVKAHADLLFQGNSWYFPELVKVGLDDGLIKLSDIKYMIKGKTETSHFGVFVRSLLEKLPLTTIKTMINPFIGMLGKTHHTEGKTIWSTSLEHACSTFTQSLDKMVHVVDLENDKTVYRVDDISIVENEHQLFLIHRKVVQSGWLKVYNRIKELTQGNPEARVLAVKTDCICVANPNSIEVSTELGGCKLENWGTNKIKSLQKDPPCVSRPSLSHKDTSSCIETVSISDEYDTSSIVDKIIGKNVLLTGRAGTGKSFVQKELIKRLRADNKVVRIAAPTHVTKRNLDEESTTIHKLFGHDITGKVHKVTFKGDETIVIDEISMMSIVFWREINYLKRRHPGIKWVLCGDFNQLRPVNEEGVDLTKSKFFIGTFDCHVDLKVNKRCSGQTHWDLMTQAINGEALTHDFPTGSYKKNLCYTNKTRKHVNRKHMLANRGDRYVELPMKPDEELVQEESRITRDTPYAPDGTKWRVYDAKVAFNAGKGGKVRRRKRAGDGNGVLPHQRMWIYEGLPVRSVINKTIDGTLLSNGDLLNVTSVDVSKSIISLVREFDGAILNVKLEDNFIYWFHPAYCMTIHSAQGQTYDEPYSLYEMECYDERLMYVALSRCTDLRLIHKMI